MWCLETIIQLNEKAAELAKQGRPTTEAYALCGIRMPSGIPSQQETREERRKRLKVEEDAA